MSLLQIQAQHVLREPAVHHPETQVNALARQGALRLHSLHGLRRLVLQDAPWRDGPQLRGGRGGEGRVGQLEEEFRR